MKKFKNNKAQADVWVGQEIAAGAYYEIQAGELIRWQNDSKVLTDIGSGDGIINNGTSDITDVAMAINFLKDMVQTADSDGTPFARIKATILGWTFQLSSVEFSTSDLSSVFSQSADGDDNYATIKCQKLVNGEFVDCDDQADADANCVRTIIDWEPDHDYELIGGSLRSLDQITSNHRVWVIGVPDVPKQYGGSKNMIVGVNMKFYNQKESLRVDGRAAKHLYYTANHTNKLRLIVEHPAGESCDYMINFEVFMA